MQSSLTAAMCVTGLLAMVLSVTLECLVAFPGEVASRAYPHLKLGMVIGYALLRSVIASKADHAGLLRQTPML